MSNNEDTPIRGIEKHIPTIISAVVIAAILWLGGTLNGLSVEVGKLSIQVVTLQKEIGMLQSQTADRYTKSDSVRDLIIRDKHVSTLEDRLSKLESRINDSHN